MVGATGIEPATAGPARLIRGQNRHTPVIALQVEGGLVMPRWLFATSLMAISAIVPSVNGQRLAVPEPPKSAHVSGTVVDASDGRFLRRAMVCFRRGADTGHQSDVYCNETDLQGRFSVAEIPPAKYAYGVDREGYFAAEPMTDQLPSVIALNAGDELTDIKLRMHRAASILGRVVYGDGEPFAGAELQLDSGPHVKSNDSGEYRFDNLSPGNYRVLVNHPDRNGNCDASHGQKERLYARQGTGTGDPAVLVNFGQEVRGPQIVMEESVPRRIAGRVVWDSYPLPGVWWIRVGSERIAVKNSDGSFVACGFAPGEYTLRTDARIAGHGVAGDLKIRIEDEDLKDLEIKAEPSASIHGRIRVEDDAPLDLANTYILPISDSAFPHDQLPVPRRQPDGSFVIDEVYSGEYRFYLSPLPSGSYLKSAAIDGRDVIDTPLLVHGGEQLEGLVFTVSPKAAVVIGIVEDDAANPVPNAIVFLQPDHAQGGVDVHLCSRTADQNGEIVCDNLAPGKYRIAAWRTFPSEPLNEVAARGTPIEVLENSRSSVILHVPK